MDIFANHVINLIIKIGVNKNNKVAKRKVLKEMKVTFLII